MPAELPLDDERLAGWLLAQRWFGSKGRELASATVLERAELAGGETGLVLAIVEARFSAGTHELYQVLGALHDGAVGEALSDPRAGARLAGLLRGNAVDVVARHVQVLGPGGRRPLHAHRGSPVGQRPHGDTSAGRVGHGRAHVQRAPWDGVLTWREA